MRLLFPSSSSYQFLQRTLSSLPRISLCSLKQVFPGLFCSSTPLFPAGAFILMTSIFFKIYIIHQNFQMLACVITMGKTCWSWGLSLVSLPAKEVNQVFLLKGPLQWEAGMIHTWRNTGFYYMWWWPLFFCCCCFILYLVLGICMWWGFAQM